MDYNPIHNNLIQFFVNLFLQVIKIHTQNVVTLHMKYWIYKIIHNNHSYFMCLKSVRTKIAIQLAYEQMHVLYVKHVLLVALWIL